MHLNILIAGLNVEQMKEMDLSKMRNITMDDFKRSLTKIRTSVSPSNLNAYREWNRKYGDVSV